MSMVSPPPFYGCSVYGTGIATGNCCDALVVNTNITSGAQVCTTTSEASTKTLQACLAAVPGNSNNSVACNLSGKASGAAPARATMLGSLALAGILACTVLATMA